MGSPSINAITGFSRKLVVGVGGLAVSNNQSVVLTTYSLGSCLGITIYDPVAKVGGLLHAMLPESSLNPAKAAEQPAMFVDTGLRALFRAAYELKLEKHRVQLCVAGGAQIMDESGFFNIGQRNYKRLSELLKAHCINPNAEAVGGFVSRTMQIDLGTGEVWLKISGETSNRVLFKG
jgi:chemotaxis protein CheD